MAEDGGVDAELAELFVEVGAGGARPAGGRRALGGPAPAGAKNTPPVTAGGRRGPAPPWVM